MPTSTSWSTSWWIPCNTAGSLLCEGNFSAAGAARISYIRDSGAPTLGLTVGEDNYYRLFASASPQVAGGTLLLGLDWSQTDGPWTLPEDFQKTSGVIKFNRGNDQAGFSVTGMGYDGSWDSTDQTPHAGRWTCRADSALRARGPDHGR
ncbi:MAG: hypothetical protein IPJ97_18245 [Proteobacteria bacterium]|nr:hypothetical protein [Pseudomonadota bacterium]